MHNNSEEEGEEGATNKKPFGAIGGLRRRRGQVQGRQITWRGEREPGGGMAVNRALAAGRQISSAKYL